MPKPPYGPADASRAPRYTGIRTFARCPYVEDPAGVDVGVVGIPFDTATSYRTGARFGPEAIRAGSALLRPWHTALEVDVFAGRSVPIWATSRSRRAMPRRRPGRSPTDLGECWLPG